MEEKPIKKNVIIRKVLKIVIVVFLACAAQYYYTKNKSVGKELAVLVANYNKACPIMISNDIRMMSVNALAHNTIQYDFTLVHVQKESINVEALKKSVETEILAGSKKNPSLDAFRDNGSTVIYDYKDNNQKELFKVVLTPDLY